MQDGRSGWETGQEFPKADVSYSISLSARTTIKLTMPEGSLIEVDEKPMLKFRNMEAVSLRPAAAPCLRFTDDKTEHTFVCTQLGSMGVRLTWSGNERILELLYQYSPIALTRDVEVACTE